MGVLGLTTFVSRNSPGDNGPGNNYQLCNCPVVIDGSSLAIQLFRSNNSARQRAPFNGDYINIEQIYRKFFHALKRCNIEPYVICDGGYDKHKLKTAIRRLESRTRDAARVNPKSANLADLLIFPLMLRDVFFHVLASMKIKYVICEWEADQEIAIVARYLNAPVLSYDSDFYIYNVSYVSLNSINLRSPVTVDEGKLYVDCTLCNPGDFAKQFRLDPELLPLLSTLLGNDYVKRSTFSKFFKNLALGSKTKGSLGQCRISGLVEWLQNENFDSAIEKVLDRFKIYQRQRIKRTIMGSCKAYVLTSCKSLEDLNLVKITAENGHDWNTQSEDDDIPNSDDLVVDGSVLHSSKPKNNHLNSCPGWLMNILKMGKISPRFNELFNHFIYINTPQVENVQLDDAHTCSLPILRFSFDLITKFENSNCNLIYIGRKFKKIVETPVPSNISIPKYLKVKLKHENNTLSKDFFMFFLGNSISKKILEIIEKQPSGMQMLLLTIVWMKSQRGSTSELLNETHIYSLLLCGIMLTTIYNEIGDIQSSSSFNKKHSTTLQQHYKTIKDNKYKNSDIQQNSASMNRNDKLAAASTLLKYFEKNEKLHSNVKLYDRQIVHSFAQFQCCLQQLNYLNIMTSESFSPCNISRLYHGTFLYNIYSDLKGRNSIEKHVSNLLQYSPSLNCYFTSLVTLINSVKRPNSKLYNFTCVTLRKYWEYHYVSYKLIIILFFVMTMVYLFYL